ncbi:hypothetical protein ACRE_056920 [Hapsidospora chrysogenum ATCC 11550]|uniref:Uncharacterized protein n=1 Tax=Hapsidospora chrysogenum (strain ATCC 11550 / CBS 779.69 / DSM 880 / IAM 14645 / JCM 23072 / IMI 49137) TaxID=857340 RepID=A0A086T2G0_HAPC1|nr:hypothetical protein ACRE_056920 [Hapsidospora chrysogenum ATCC 11550]
MAVREGWESVREAHEKKLSEVLGEPWTVDIDALSLFPYAAEDSWARSSPGEMIASYVSDAVSRLRYLIDRLGSELRTEINDACPARILTMDLDEDELFSYCGCKVSADGKLVIVFRETYLGTNISSALDQSHLEMALNEAPTTRATKPMNFRARMSIAGAGGHSSSSSSSSSSIRETQRRLSALLGGELALVPGYEAVFDKLRASEEKERVEDWDAQLGPFVHLYFDGLLGYLEYHGFGADQMLREGLLEAVKGGEVRFRLVDEIKRPYNEAVIEDGVLYLQVSTCSMKGHLPHEC